MRLAHDRLHSYPAADAFRGAVCLALVALAVLGAAPAQSADVCEGYPSSRIITALGGRNAFSSESADTLADLQRLAVEMAPDIRYSLDTQGLAHLADPLFAAIASGEGVTERSLRRGEIFEWMSWRSGGEPRVSEDLCFAARKPYDAWQIDLVTEERSDDCATTTATRHTFLAPKACVNVALVGVSEETTALPAPPAPVCQVEATRSCDSERTISIDATGSSPSVVVKLGSRVVIPAGSDGQSTTVEDASPYAAATVTATAETRDACGRPQTCEATATVEPCVAASCALASVPTSVKAGQAIPIDVNGNWANDNIKIVIKDSKGNVVREVSPPFPTTVTLRRAGDYQISGVATNALGDEATCEVPVTVKRRCTVRGLLGKLSPGSREHHVGFGDPVVTDRTELGFHGGGLAGAELECFVTPALGLAGGLLLGDLGGRFMRDLEEDWETVEKDFDVLVLSAGPNWHFNTGGKVDFYIGAFAALVQLGDATFSALGDTQRIDLDDHFGFGGQVGLSIPFGEGPWSFHAGGRYLDLSADSTALGGFDLDISPTIFTVGIGYDF